MTRASTPRFDPYEELEVSRQATPEVIEAAYRALAKRHHPDVAAADDLERIKRLNEARDTLLSPTRRARYDGASTGAAARPRPQVRRERRSEGVSTAQPGRPARPARASSAVSFGIHSRDVRQFLAELREIDGARAAAVLEAKAAVEGAAYMEARTASLAASRGVRTDEWGFARDAASVIVRGKLDESPLARAVSGVVADVAGAIVVRDLLAPGQFLLLLEPWTRSKAGPAAIPPREPAHDRRPMAIPALGIPLGMRSAIPGHLRAALPAQLREALPARLRAAASRRPVALGILGSALALLIVAGVLGLGADRHAAVAGLTSGPTSGAVGLGGTPATPGPLVPIDPSGPPAGSATPGASGPSAIPTFDLTPLGPGPTLQPGAPTPRPTPIVTPRPTVVVTAAPSPPPTATPSPTTPLTPTPSPTPSPSPRVICTVPDLVGLQSNQAQVRWTAEGFTGTVLFSPQPPPKYVIGWQSLEAGTDAPCTSDITVQPAAP
ncbi:MAG TPA: J domain-containing protein [Candidatus Limnocylindrales bacterium]|nr:J domain-containing protein [Candidatus Limnocylindrales bacterium]